MPIKPVEVRSARNDGYLFSLPKGRAKEFLRRKEVPKDEVERFMLHAVNAWEINQHEILFADELYKDGNVFYRFYRRLGQ